MGESVFLKEMGKRITVRRKALCFTQEALAEKIDVSTQMISNLELGKKAIRPENLAKVCEALEVSADYILTGANTKKSYVNIVADKLIDLSEDELEIINNLIDYMVNKK